MPKPLRTSTTVSLLFLALAVPLVLVDVGTLIGSVREAEESVESQLSVVTQAVRLKTEALLSEAAQVLKAVAVNETIRTGPPSAVSSLLREVHDQYEQYTNFSLVNPEGFIVAGSTQMDAPIDVSGAVNIRTALEEKRVSYSRFVIGPITGKPVIVVSLPLTDDGSVYGVLNNGLSLEWVEGFLESLSESATTETVLLDGNGLVLASHPPHSVEIGTDMSEMEPARQALERDVDSESFSADDNRYLFAVASTSIVPDGLYILSYRESDEALSAPRRRNIIHLLLNLAVLGCAVGIAWWVANQIVVRPLQILSRHASKVSQGDFSGRLDKVSSTLEVIQVVGAFNHMTENLSDHEAAQEATRRDLEDRVSQRTVELREALEKAQAASQSKTEFLANVSHELRTPLNGIHGMAQLLARSSLGGEQERLLRILQDSADNLTRIVEDLIQMTRIEKGQMTFRHVPFDATAIVSAVVASFQSGLEENSVRLTCDADTSASLCIGDPACTAQIVENLLSNAVKFTKEGEIVVAVRAEDGLRIEVSDTGPGIPKEKRQAVFESFRQLENPYTKHEPGLGLGLAIVRSIVAGLGGRITLESTLGVGSTFSVHLPFRCKPAVETTATEDRPQQPDRSRGDERVLVVEDDAVNRLYLIRLLQDEGWSVDQAKNSREAMGHVTSTKYGAVLMDVGLPDTDGVATTKAIRDLEAREAAPKTPIIAVTAHAQPEDRQRCIEAGMDAVVTKPYTRERLLSVLHALSGTRG